jgi:DegV family protein with EDD domain
MGRVAVVTDTSAYLTRDELASLGVVAVELQVVVDGQPFDDSSYPPDDLAAALRGGSEVTTSRPSPAMFTEAYRAAADGADAIVSLHLSGHLSGTVEAARLAAKDAPVPVEVVDTGQIGLGLGFAVRSAAAVARAGGDAAAVAAAARQRAERTANFLFVDTLEYLQRGGRTDAKARASLLPVKPLLQVKDGRVIPADMVRTVARGLTRLTELAVEAADDVACEVAVQHLAAADRAKDLAARVEQRLTEAGHPAASVEIREVGAALGAHVGPGMVGVTVAPE